MHVTSEMLVDYYARSLAPSEEACIEEHLSECQECTRRAGEMHVLCYAWDRWTLLRHSKAAHETDQEMAVR